MIPTANSDPDTGVQLTTGFGSTLSTAVGAVHVTAAVELPRSVGVDMLIGCEMNCGDSSSDMKEIFILNFKESLWKVRVKNRANMWDPFGTHHHQQCFFHTNHITPH